MAIAKIRALVTFTLIACRFHTIKSERSCIYPGIASTSPLTSEPSIHRIINVKHDTVIKFWCKQNYTLQGQKVIRCEDGRWIGRIPYCKEIEENIFQRFMNFLLQSLFKHLVFEPIEVLCKNPGNISFGNKNKHQKLYRVGATVRYRCNKGYATQEGPSTIRCTANGTWNNQPPNCINCTLSLGIERSIPNERIRGSTEKDNLHKAREGRLNGQRAWCSGREMTPYIQINLGRPHKITSLATQGSAFDKKWVGWYAVKSSLGGTSFNTYRENDQEKMFSGNTDASSIHKHELKNAFVATKIRFYPIKSGGFTNEHACMRVEVYGCEY